MKAAYDEIGGSYRRTRQPDPRIADLIDVQVGAADTILNIGAGAGSYEPRGRTVIAAEPSSVMLGQRPPGSAPAVQAIAEALPFGDRSFDLSMTILSIHHWSDWRRGVGEAMRVSDGRFLILTWTGFPRGFWLMDYFPEIEELDLSQFPTVSDLEHELGTCSPVTVPVPHDCRDGFLCAYWRRPDAYLDPLVRAGMSTFSKLANMDSGLERLADDLSCGRWDALYGHLRFHGSYDYGYRILSFTR